MLQIEMKRRLEKSINHLPKLLAIAVLVGIYGQAAAQSTIAASQDTYITQNPSLGGSNSTHGFDTFLQLVRGGIGGPATGFETFPFIKFDLSPFVGSTVISTTASFRMQITGSNTVPTQTVSVRQLLIPWNEQNAPSYNNFGGTGFSATTQTGPNLVTRSVTFTGVPSSIEFLIPISVVQGWIDNPSSNFGLMLYSPMTIGSDDLRFSSREGSVSPTLTFSAVPVPEPATALLFGIGVLGIACLRVMPRTKGHAHTVDA